MSRMKFVMLGLVVVFGASAMVSAIASAAEPAYFICQKNAKGKYTEHQCITEGAGEKWEEQTLGQAETVTIAGSSGVSELEGEIATQTIVIVCNNDRFSGYIAAHGRSSLSSITFENCKIYKRISATERELLTACTVPNITTNPIDDQLREPESGRVEDEFFPHEGMVFTEIKITGSLCAVKGGFKVEGTQTCKVPNGELKKQAIIHELNCTPGKNLTLGGKEAKFTSNERINLVNEWDWYVAA